MFLRLAMIAGLLILGACERQDVTTEASPESPQLDAPAPEGEPTRTFETTNEAAATATGALSFAITVRMPDARGGQGDAQEVLTLRGANGAVIEANVSAVVSPATQVQGQTLRALLDVPVQEARLLVYQVTGETKANGRGVCGSEDVSYVVVWEPSEPGDPQLKILGVSGGAPGAAAARACPMLAYRRA